MNWRNGGFYFSSFATRVTLWTFCLFSNIMFCIDFCTLKICTNIRSSEESLHKIPHFCEMIDSFYYKRRIIKDETRKKHVRLFYQKRKFLPCIQRLWSRNFLRAHWYFSRLIQLTEGSSRFLRRSRCFRQALFFRSFWPPSLIRMTVDT